MCAALLGCQKETPNQEPVVLDTPVLSSSDITSSGFTVAWGGVEHASAYAYTLSTADGTVSSDENYAETSVTFSDLDANTGYEIRVKALSPDETLYLDSKEAVLTVTTSIQKTAFDAPALAQKLGTGFETFRTDYSAYEIASLSADGIFVMGAYAEISGEQYPLTVEVTEDAYGNVGSIVATPDNSDDDMTLFTHYLNNYETLNLGEWLGAKYNVFAEDGSSEGGICYTIDETLGIVNSNDVDNLSVHALFGVISGKAYAVPSFEDGRFKFQLVNNFLRLDYPMLYTLLGSDYSAFAKEHYIIGNNLEAWGEYYFNIDYTLDMMDNAFSCDFYTDAERTTINSISLSAYDSYTTDEQMDIWEYYVTNPDALNLGQFKEAYTLSFGSVVSSFSSVQEVLDYVEANGRPGGFDPDLVVVFGDENTSLEIILKSIYLYIEITPAE